MDKVSVVTGDAMRARFQPRSRSCVRSSARRHGAQYFPLQTPLTVEIVS